MGPAAESRKRRDETHDEPPPDLEIDQDMRFSRRDWRAHRIGWAALAAVVAIAAAGGFGRGALADEERSAGEMSVRYDRVARHEARSLLEVRVPPHAQTVWIDQSLEERWRIEHIVPEPDSVRVDGDRVIYDIDVGEQGGVVRFDMKPERNGRAQGHIGVDDASVPVEQWVLP